MLYLVSYNSSIGAEAKARLEGSLRAMPGWWHHLDTTWVVATDLDLQALTDQLHNALGTDDKFFVVNITFGNYNGWLQSKAWDWLRDDNARERGRIQGTNRNP